MLLIRSVIIIMLANGDKTRPCGHILCTLCFRADRVSGQGTAIGRVCLSVRQPVSTPAVDATANLCANLIHTYAKSVPLTRIKPFLTKYTPLALDGDSQQLK